MHEPMLWKSYSVEDKIDFLVESGYLPHVASDYAMREFDSLPYKVRELVKGLDDASGAHEAIKLLGA